MRARNAAVRAGAAASLRGQEPLVAESGGVAAAVGPVHVEDAEALVGPGHGVGHGLGREQDRLAHVEAGAVGPLLGSRRLCVAA